MANDPFLLKPGAAPRPRPIGVYADDRAVYLVLAPEDLAALGNTRTLHVLRGKKSLGLSAAPDASPIFLTDLEAELDLKTARFISVLVIDPAALRKTGEQVRLIWLQANTLR